ncbi:MAG: hypothetical protein J6P58_01495 [Oscillospiraceae bacterium]|nr:hypothetical protein [Oscillospiraceae bacterium]
MKKAGRVILIVVLAAVLLGAVCVGVGLMTGADTMRIYSALDDRYNIAAYQEAYAEYAGELIDFARDVWQALTA